MSNASLHCQLTDLVHWATARIAELDRDERFEESYALTEEFRDWILCLEQHPELVNPLLAPPGSGWKRRLRNERERREPELRQPDGLLGI
jgi:hypothetical protein